FLAVGLTAVVRMFRLAIEILAVAAVLFLALVVALVTARGLIMVIVALAVIIVETVLLLLLLRFEARIQNTVVVIGMLEIIFRRNPVAHGAGIARHRQELFHKLLRVAARPHVAAIEIRVAVRPPTAAHGTWLATVTTALSV